jgi:photosystem II stability/assembly factor-like uncharacterized protein
MRTRLILPAIAVALALMGAGCVTIGGSSTTSPASDGGVFKSANKGDTWTQKVSLPTIDGSRRTIGSVSVSTIVQDQNDSEAIYIGTADNGMFYSYDGGNSWRQPAQADRGRIPSIAVNPKEKCTVYVAKLNQLIKTKDCSRSWAVSYLDTRQDNVATSVVVDFYNPDIIYVGMQSGDLYKSSDAGATWKLLYSCYKTPIVRVVMSTNDSRKLYVALKGQGIWRSDDAGLTWKDLSVGYKDFSGAKEFMDIALVPAEPKTVMFASKFGILRSNDGGDTWEKVDLLTPPGTTLIYSLAVDPRDKSIIYYGTATTFYRTTNGGSNWVPKKLPTSRAATVLMVDRSNSDVLYLGTTKFKD